MEEETIKAGMDLCQILKKGDVVVLSGELGAGKTRFVKGVAMGFGLEDPRKVTSPSFSLLYTYEGSIPIYHMDYYRLSSVNDVLDAGLDPFEYGEGIVIVEWGEKFPELFLQPHFKVQIEILSEVTRRIITGKYNTSKEWKELEETKKWH